MREPFNHHNTKCTTQQNIQTLPYILSFANTLNIVLINRGAFDIKKNSPICFASNLKIFDNFLNEVSKIRKGLLTNN